MIKNIVYKNLLELKHKYRSSVVALIDPDCKNDDILEKLINSINECGFDVIFIGGSLIMDNNFDKRIKFIKSRTDLPIILFPGSSHQLSVNADAILYLSLISGRNPQFLIGEHVISAPKIYNIGLEVIPTGYILIDGGCKTSVEIMSNTKSIPPDKKDIILSHALAGQYLGCKLIYLEMGSNSKNAVPGNLIKYLKNIIDIPIVVGGGIKSVSCAENIASSGADFIVMSSLLEELEDVKKIKNMCNLIHGI